jgi:hypothetical protein
MAEGSGASWASRGIMGAAALKQQCPVFDRLTSELFNDAPRRFAPVDLYALA